MKGVKKWTYTACLSFLALVLSVVISFLLGTVNVNAESYSIDSIFVHAPAFPTSYSSNSVLPHSDYLSVDVSSSSGLSPRNASYLWSVYDSSSQKCKYFNSYKRPGYTVHSTNVVFDNYFLAPFISDYSSTDDFLCRTMYPYNSIISDESDSFTVPAFDSSSVPFNVKLNVDSFLPFNYMYNTIDFSHNRVVDGVSYESHFDLSELLQNSEHTEDSEYTYYSDIITGFNFPLNFDSTLHDISEDDTISLSGHIGTSSRAYNSSLFSGNLVIGYNFNNGMEFQNLPCTFADFPDSYSIDYLCSGTLNSYASSADYYSLNLDFSFGGAFSSEHIPITFSNPLIVFDNDHTYAGTGSVDGNGSFPNSAPGVARPEPSDADYFHSLTHMFDFMVINPFNVWFNTISDPVNSSCASIPNIAGMLHSEETTYCPWFSSETRSVLTPIFTVASTMLLFGFIVRWLKSGSGNNMEDS